MNSFELIGQAQLLASEGQRQLFAAMLRAVGGAIRRALLELDRNAPPGALYP